MSRASVILFAALCFPFTVGNATADSLRLVVAAPGFPGDTVAAQPTMDELARAIERAAGWPRGRIEAVYHPSVEGGLESLADADAALALVPLPFYLRFADTAGLAPLLEVAQTSGTKEVWSLVARRAAVTGPRDLEGWELAGNPGYAPAFVRHVALAGWGPLPANLRIEFTARVLSALRRAARGEDVAVLIDRAQAGALESLPFAGELEIVTRSEPLTASVLCEVGARLTPAETAGLVEAFLRLDEIDAESELLETMRIEGFERLGPAGLEPLVQRFGAAR